MQESEKQALRECWSYITNPTYDQTTGESSASKFYEFVWSKWVQLDEYAEVLFRTVPYKQRVKHLTRVMSLIVKYINNTTEGLEALKKVGLQHCTANIDSKNFDALATAISEGFERALGSKKVSTEVKEGWFTVITTMGKELMSEYKTVKEGWTDANTFRFHNGAWKKAFCKLTNEAFVTYKSQSMKRVADKLLWDLISSVGPDHGEALPPPPTEKSHIFYLETGGTKKYFAAANEQSRTHFLEYGDACLRIYVRLADVPKKTNLSGSNGKKRNSSPNIGSCSDSEGSREESARGNFLDFSVFDSLPHATIIINETGIIKYVNPATIDVTGYTASEMLLRNVKMLMIDKTAASHDEYIKRYIRTGKSKFIGVKTLVPVKTGSGNEIQCYLTVTEHTSDSGRYFIGTLLEEGDGETDSSASFSVFDNMSHAIFACDATGIIKYANNAASKILGYPNPDIVNKTLKNFVDEQFTQKRDTFFLDYFNEGVQEKKSHRIGFRQQSGEKIFGEFDVVLHASGESKMYIGTLNSNVESSEEALRKMLAKHKEVFYNLQVPVIVCTADGIVQLCNSPAVKAFGYTEDKIIGKNVSILMSKEYALKHDQYIQKYIKTGKSRIIGKGRLVKVKCADGTARQAHLTVTCKTSETAILFVGVMAVLSGEDFDD